MSRRTPFSPTEMARRGWTRTDPRPWSKLNARWRHASGWTLEHCGHPTALWPWLLRDPTGLRVLTGVTMGNPPDFGTAWPDLRRAVEWLGKHLETAAG